MADPKKPGYRTTEFWLTLIATLLSAAYAGGLIGDGGTVGKVAALATVALTTLGYTVTRGALKQANAAPK